jgi:hypothetical protein
MLDGVPIASPFRFPTGVSTVICTASNQLGATTCNFNVTVVDLGTAPVFTSCPADITVNNDIGHDSALVKFTVAAAGEPAPVITCRLGDVVITSPFRFPIGVSTVICTASNPVGTATCSFNVTVLDSGTMPVFTACPGDIKVCTDYGDCSALVKFTVTAAGVPAPVVTCMLGGVPITSPFEFPKGVNTVMCTASNLFGVATCSFNVTVVDRQAPEVAVRPGPKTGYYELLSRDNCDSDPRIFVRDSASDFVAGPFASEDIVRITINRNATPEQRTTGGVVRIILNGPPLFVAVDADGNCAHAETLNAALRVGRRIKGHGWKWGHDDGWGRGRGH